MEDMVEGEVSSLVLEQEGRSLQNQVMACLEVVYSQVEQEQEAMVPEVDCSRG